jgi:hypothetical protein
MNKSNSSRRDFLKASALAGLGASAATLATQDAAARDIFAEPVTLPSGIVIQSNIGVTRPRPAGQKPVHDLTTQPLEKVRVGIIGLNRGMAHVAACLKIEFCEIVAVSAIRVSPHYLDRKCK